VFPAIHPEVGDIEIFDDGKEVTVKLGNLTHVHFDNYDTGLSEAEVAERLSSGVLSFLEDLFSDKIVVWGSHRGAGGYYHRDHKRPRSLFSRRRKKYVWSGPLSESG
jgi:hypothetical protein